MKVSELTHVKNLHHAYVAVGNASRGASEVLAMLRARGIKTLGNQDVLTLFFSEFTVDAARDVSSYASLKALKEAKYIIVTFSRATLEAQNALLKVVEEAPGSSIFFFCVDAAGHLLPTLRSRIIEVSLDSTLTLDEQPTEVKEFLSGSFEERLKMVDTMASEISKTQDRTSVRAFVKALLTSVHAKGATPAALRDLLDAERYMRIQGSSVKAVLGHLAVTLPRSRV